MGQTKKNAKDKKSSKTEEKDTTKETVKEVESVEVKEPPKQDEETKEEKKEAKQEEKEEKKVVINEQKQEETKPNADKEVQQVVVREVKESLRPDKLKITFNNDTNIITLNNVINLSTETKCAAIRHDTKSIILEKLFEATSSVECYIKYKSGTRRIEQNRHEWSGLHSELYQSSYDTFCPDVAYVMHGFNEQYFTTNGTVKNSLRFVGEVPMSKVGLIDYGSVAGGTGNAEFFNGVICIVAKIMMDSRVLFDVKHINIMATDDNSVFLRQTVLENPQPSMVLASRNSPIRWFESFIRRLIDLGEDVFTYYYGRSSSYSESSTDIKLVEHFGVNTDQYYAAIMNLNARYLCVDTDITERMRAYISAYGLQDTVFDIGTTTGLTPFNLFEPSVATQVVFMSAFLNSEFTDIVLEDNLAYFESCNIFSYDEAFTLCKLDNNSPSSNILISILTRRIDMCDFSYINYLMALEISPVFLCCSIHPISTINSVESAVIHLIEFYLFSLVYPNTFDRIKGLLQKSFQSIFRVLCSQQAIALDQQIGNMYVIRDDGRPEFIVPAQGDFSEDDFFSGYYPSWFYDLSSFNAPVINRIMRLFVPIGELVSDSYAIEAGFPRLDKNPRHYIPFKYVANGYGTAFSDAVTNFCAELKKILIDATKSEGTNSSSSALNVAKSFLQEIVSSFREFDTTFNTLVPLYYRTRANTLFNIGDSFGGVFRSSKRTNYALISDNNVVRRLYRKNFENKEKFKISTAVVWQLFGHGTSVLMRRSRNPDRGIPLSVVNEQICFPDESLFIKESLRLYTYFQKSLIPVSLTSILFSDRLLPDVRNKAIIRGILNINKAPTSILDSVYVSVADSLNISTEKLSTCLAFDKARVRKSPVCINPTIRRVDLITQAIVNFDPNVDNVFIRDVLCPLPTIMIERLKIALSLIVSNTGFRPRKGLRLVKYVSPSSYPDFKPSIPVGAIELTYNPNLFISQQTQQGPMLCWLINGVPYLRDLPVIHLVIHDITRVHSSHMRVIKDTILQHRAIVDLPNIQYIPIITSSRVQTLAVLDTILKRSESSLIEIPFSDGTGQVSSVRSMPYGDETYDQYIFPLNNIMQNYAIGSLHNPNDDVPPSDVILPSRFNLDTGTLDEARMPVFTHNHIQKVGHSKISMSNVVSVFTKNLVYHDDFIYSRALPPILFESFNNVF